MHTDPQPYINKQKFVSTSFVDPEPVGTGRIRNYFKDQDPELLISDPTTSNFFVTKISGSEIFFKV